MTKIYRYIATILILGLSSCGKDFLKITPIDNLSGNNYWQTEEDVKMFIGGLYSGFRNATMQHAFFPATGDLRAAPFERNSGSNTTQASFNWMSYIRYNNLNAINAQYYLTENRGYGTNTDYFGFARIGTWKYFYEVIAKANIAIYEIENLEDGIISAEKKQRYIAEAAFMRNISYFFIVRLFGDVPYYTQAYHSDPIGRTPMLQVLKSLDEDLNKYYKNLPWTQEDPTEVGNRPMRGAAIDLLMQINMWAAGFSETGKRALYERVESLGAEIMNENGGAYTLLPLERTKEIFKGRTKEGLFEITQNYNYGELFHLSSAFADNVLKAPYKPLIRASYIHYKTDFIESVYPPGVADMRKSIWFEEENLYKQNGDFVMIKNQNIFVSEDEDGNPDDNMIVFRYADAILLRAEALAELEGREIEAVSYVNMIRDRAKAAPLTNVTGTELKDAIFWERVREFMGEGHYYYDLVRTKRILNSDFCEPIPIDDFYRGAWTWPLNRSAGDNNPNIEFSRYWN